MMYEEKEMEAIRKDVILQVECILNDIGPVFDKQVLDDARTIRNRHNNIPLEEVLRPFTI